MMRMATKRPATECPPTRHGMQVLIPTGLHGGPLVRRRLPYAGRGCVGRLADHCQLQIVHVSSIRREASERPYPRPCTVSHPSQKRGIATGPLDEQIEHVKVVPTPEPGRVRGLKRLRRHVRRVILCVSPKSGGVHTVVQSPRDTRSSDVLHVGVKRDPTNFSTPAMRVTL